MATTGVAGPLHQGGSERRTGQGIEVRRPEGVDGSPGTAASRVSSMRVRSVRVHPNKRLKLTAHVEYGMNLSPVRCSLSTIR